MKLMTESNTSGIHWLVGLHLYPIPRCPCQIIPAIAITIGVWVCALCTCRSTHKQWNRAPTADTRKVIRSTALNSFHWEWNFHLNEEKVLNRWENEPQNFGPHFAFHRSFAHFAVRKRFDFRMATWPCVWRTGRRHEIVIVAYGMK